MSDAELPAQVGKQRTFEIIAPPTEPTLSLDEQEDDLVLPHRAERISPGPP